MDVGKVVSEASHCKVAPIFILSFLLLEKMLGKVKSSFEHIGHIFNFQSLEVSLSHIRID